MFFLRILRYALYLLGPFCILSTGYLYLYPILHLCAFPSPEGASNHNAFLTTLKAHANPTYLSDLPTFRLLAVGDPQLEGTSSLDLSAKDLPNFRKLQDVLHSHDLTYSWRAQESLKLLRLFWSCDVPRVLNNWRKQIDLWGNDLYIAHLVRIMNWWTKPTHITVLGDLLGSQWIDDKEFNRRAGRFWNRVFRGYEKIDDEAVNRRNDRYGGAMGKKVHKLGWNGVEGDEEEEWTKRLINLAGNHDIGYAGDATKQRVRRFEKAFGKVNYEMTFSLPLDPVLHNHTEKEVPTLCIIVLNNMNLDGPVISEHLQTQTYNFINSIINSSPPVGTKGVYTLLLTHIPLHKREGICTDAPLFRYHQSERHDVLYQGIEEQNFLSEHSSHGILEGIFGMSGNPATANDGLGRNGLIMTGHDHEGCDVYHYINQSAVPPPPSTSSPETEGEEKKPQWEAQRYRDAKTLGLSKVPDMPGLRELTVRSAMGDFHGNIGLLSVSFNASSWDWESGFTNCRFGKTWIWWVIWIVDIITLALATVWYVLDFVERVNPSVAIVARERERERRDWLAGRGDKDIYGRSVSSLDGAAFDGKGGSGKRKDTADGRSRSRGKDSGASSGSDSGSSSESKKRNMRRKRSKESLRRNIGPGRRQLSTVVEMQEFAELE